MTKQELIEFLDLLVALASVENEMKAEDGESEHDTTSDGDAIYCKTGYVYRGQGCVHDKERAAEIQKP